MSNHFVVTEFQSLIDESFQRILKFLPEIPEIKTLGVHEHLTHLFDYNIPGGKHVRSCLCLSVAKSYSPDSSVADEAVVAMTLEIVCNFMFFFITIHPL